MPLGFHDAHVGSANGDGLKIQTPKVVEAMFPAALGAIAPKSNSDIQGLISADAPFNVQLDKD